MTAPKFFAIFIPVMTVVITTVLIVLVDSGGKAAKTAAGPAGIRTKALLVVLGFGMLVLAAIYVFS